MLQFATNVDELQKQTFDGNAVVVCLCVGGVGGMGGVSEDAILAVEGVVVVGKDCGGVVGPCPHVEGFEGD